MAGKSFNWLAALPLAWSGLACSALIEVELPRADAREPGMYELLAILPAAGGGGNRLHATRAARDATLPGAVVVRAAQSGALIPTNAADIHRDFLVRAEPLFARGHATKDDSIQAPELWTLVFLGAGLVAYQVRRQTRNSRVAIRFSS